MSLCMDCGHDYAIGHFCRNKNEIVADTLEEILNYAEDCFEAWANIYSDGLIGFAHHRSGIFPYAIYSTRNDARKSGPTSTTIPVLIIPLNQRKEG